MESQGAPDARAVVQSSRLRRCVRQAPGRRPRARGSPRSTAALARTTAAAEAARSSSAHRRSAASCPRLPRSRGPLARVRPGGKSLRVEVQRHLVVLAGVDVPLEGRQAATGPSAPRCRPAFPLPAFHTSTRRCGDRSPATAWTSTLSGVAPIRGNLGVAQEDARRGRPARTRHQRRRRAGNTSRIRHGQHPVALQRDAASVRREVGISFRRRKTRRSGGARPSRRTPREIRRSESPVADLG